MIAVERYITRRRRRRPRFHVAASTTTAPIVSATAVIRVRKAVIGTWAQRVALAASCRRVTAGLSLDVIRRAMLRRISGEWPHERGRVLRGTHDRKALGSVRVGRRSDLRRLLGDR